MNRRYQYHDKEKDKEFIINSMTKYLEEKQEIDKAIQEIIELITEANIYCNNLAPWKLIKNNNKRMNECLSVLIEIIRRSTIMLFPIIPDSCKKIYLILNINDNEIFFKNYNSLPSHEYNINISKPIFPRIDFDIVDTN